VISEITNEFRITGKVEGFDDSKRTLNEMYFQRFAKKQGTFREIHVIGSALETLEENGRESTKAHHFDQYVRFDELGIFEGEPGDPVDLIPLYPGHPVRRGDWWNPVAKVRIALGEGNANYQFVIDSVFSDKNKHQLALIKVEFEGNLIPHKELTGWNVFVKGQGWFNWNCSINQRRDTHINATYLAKKDSQEIKQFISVNDTLIVQKKKRAF
jgi:hypothetical protein